MIGRDWISAALCLLRYSLGGKTNISQFLAHLHMRAYTHTNAHTNSRVFFFSPLQKLQLWSEKQHRHQKKIEIKIHGKQMASNRATVSLASNCDFGQEYGGLGGGSGGRGGGRGGVEDVFRPSVCKTARCRSSEEAGLKFFWRPAATAL